MKGLFLCACSLLLLASGCQKKQHAKAQLRAIYDQPCFSEVCAQAARDEDRFATFKADPFFNLICERSSYEEGERAIEAIERDYPELHARCGQFRENDRLGSPRVYDYGKWGVFSPTTLGYVAMAARARAQLGDLSGKRILQIGAGYGGLCKILSELFTFKSYTIVDFQPQLDLTQSYLERLGVLGVTFCTWENLSVEEGVDCAISEGQFSELCAEEQQRLLEQVMKHVDLGCLWGEVVPQHFGVSTLGPDLIARRLGKFGNEVSLEKGDGKNYQLYWTIK
jgi:hypothetical protein